MKPFGPSVIYGNKVSHVFFHPNGECVITKARPVVEIVDAAGNVFDRVAEPIDLVAAAEMLEQKGLYIRHNTQ